MAEPWLPFPIDTRHLWGNSLHSQFPISTVDRKLFLWGNIKTQFNSLQALWVVETPVQSPLRHENHKRSPGISITTMTGLHINPSSGIKPSFSSLSCASQKEARTTNKPTRAETLMTLDWSKDIGPCFSELGDRTLNPKFGDIYLPLGNSRFLSPGHNSFYFK